MPCREHVRRFGAGALCCAALLLAGANAGAAETELSGRADIDMRVFAVAPKHAGQAAGRLQPSLLLRPELYMKWNDGDDSLTAIPIWRIDAVDGERTHGDLREFSWLHVADEWIMTAGIDTVFWGATESRHLVDIINQTDLVEDPGGEEKLGQPMINLAYQFDTGDVSLFWLPIFRERTFPGEPGRFRSAIVVDTTRASFPDGKGATDFAIRYTRTLGAWDAGLTYFHGTSRAPRAVLGTNAQGQIVIVPAYDRISQVGFDLQGAIGDWLWKVEAIGNKGHAKRFAAFVGGFEYTKYGVFDSDADLGFIAEYLYDGRGVNAPDTSYDDDVFIGARLSLNDVSDTSFLGGIMVDRDNAGTSISFEFSTRLTDFVSIDMEAQAFRNLSTSDPLAVYDRDNNILFRVSRYF